MALYDGAADATVKRNLTSDIKKLQNTSNYLDRYSGLKEYAAKGRRMDGFPRDDLERLAGYCQDVVTKKKLNPQDIYLIGIHSGGCEPMLAAANRLGIPSENTELVRWSKSRGDTVHLMSELVKPEFYRKMKGKHVFVFDDTCGSGSSLNTISDVAKKCRLEGLYCGVVNNYGEKRYDLNPSVTKVHGKGPATVWEMDPGIKTSAWTKIKRFFHGQYYSRRD